MPINQPSRNLRRWGVALTLTVAASVCSANTASTTVLFDQPTESGIAGHFFVAHVTHAGMPTGIWDLVALQPNPATPTGQLVPTSWDAGARTGFTPNSPSTAQLGFRNEIGTTTAQMEGGMVGAYLNSADLPTTRSNQLMMISPQFKFQSGTTPVPFASSSSSLNGEMDLQIPTASGKDTYVSLDLSFKDANGLSISYSVNVFHNGAPHALKLDTTYDAAENVYILDTPLEPGQQFVTPAQGSAIATGTPWLGLRHFQWTIDQAQFVGALKYLALKYPGKIKTVDPTQSVLDEVHLNAEFHYSPAPAELGWSMSGLKVWTSG